MKQKRRPFGVRRRWAFFIALLIAVIVVLSGMLVWYSQPLSDAELFCMTVGVERHPFDADWADCWSGVAALLTDNEQATAEAEIEQMSPEEGLDHATQVARDSQRSQQEMTATPAAGR